MLTENSSHTYVQRKFCSQKNFDCPISDGFSTIFNKDLESNESQFKIPSRLGSGCSKRIQLGNSMDACFNDMKLHKEIQLSGKTQGDVFVLMICLGENMIWQEKNSRQSMELEENAGMLYHVRDIEETGIYEENRHYQGITFTFDSSRFFNYFSREEEAGLFSNKLQNYEYAKNWLSSEAKIVLSQILRCPYAGKMKALYLEGKALELLSIFVSTITAQNSVSGCTVKLSKTDIESIIRARDILDNSVSCPITISSVARAVCLNESKLKSGFKQIYGKPVYTYLLDKRMETARVILETQSVSISQVAGVVGYESGSSFSKAFCKKFGFYPSECMLK